MKVTLTWPRDRGGYRLETTGGSWRAEFNGHGSKPWLAVRDSGEQRAFPTRREAEDFAGKANAKITIAHGSAPDAWVVSAGGDLVFSNALKSDGLCRELAAATPDARGALAFVERHGFLRASKGRERVADIVAAIRVGKSLVAARTRGDVAALQEWLALNGKAIQVHAALGDDGTLFFQPKNLIDAVYLQFFADGDAAMKCCARPGCGNWFKFGPGTDPPKRSTAIYCSRTCEKAAQYKRLKAAKSARTPKRRRA
jgi:hypothetical protein